MLGTAPAFSSFSVPDMGAAKHFYADTLGLQVKETPEGLQLDLAGGVRVFIYHSATNKPADFTVLNFSVADIDAAVDQLVANGVRFEQYDEPYIKTDAKGVSRGDGTTGPQAVAWCKDPAGNIIGILQE